LQWLVKLLWVGVQLIATASTQNFLRRIATENRIFNEMKNTAFCVILMLASCFAYRCKADSPDPAVLLQGVEQARLQIPASRLIAKMVYTNSLASVSKQLVVEFDGNKRRYLSGETKSGDLFDGSQAICFDGKDSVTLRDTSDATANYLFDPRLLGITTTYSWGETIETAVPHQNVKKIELIGAEQINGLPVWHVRLIDSYDQQINLWINSDHGFRVYRYDFSILGETNSTLSYYENPDYPWLPSRVETSYRSGTNGSILSGRTTSILKAEKAKLPEKTWTIAGVQPAIGAAVSDLRIKQRIGYWNGHGLSQRADLEPEFEPVKMSKRFPVLMIIIFLVGPVVFLWHYYSSKRKPLASTTPK
jgi:hypothetical protein